MSQSHQTQKSELASRISRWLWFGVVAGLLPICLDFVVVIGTYFTTKKAEADWWDPVRKGQLLLVATSIYAACVAETLESSATDDHSRTKVVGGGYVFGPVAAMMYATIAFVERNHNDKWDVRYGVGISIGMLVIAIWVSYRWAGRKP